MQGYQRRVHGLFGGCIGECHRVQCLSWRSGVSSTAVETVFGESTEEVPLWCVLHVRLASLYLTGQWLSLRDVLCISAAAHFILCSRLFLPLVTVQSYSCGC